jgi:hypothetical protein
MLAFKLNGWRGDGVGMCWPQSPSAVGTVEEVFGPRTFASPPHAYPYDLHAGIDVDADAGDPIYSSLSGAVCRRHVTHFGFEDAEQLSEFTESDAASSATFALGSNELTVTCARVGVVSLANAAKYAMAARVSPTAGNYVLEVNFDSVTALTGTFGIGVFNAADTEYVGIETDGTNIVLRGVGTTTFTADAASYAVAGRTWLRIEYTASTNTYNWKHSGDGETWTSITTETGRAFTLATPHMRPCLYWKSADTNATPFTVMVYKFNLADENISVGRFGNWIQISAPGRKIVLGHMRKVPAALGTFVSAGQIVGYSGETGFDAASGRIQTEHLHLELALTNAYEYSRAESVNPLRAGYLPRTNVSNNVAVVRDTANDPDAVDCHRLTITVTRADQDFDVNSITLTGNTTSRTINLDSRSGLNADVDTPKQSGVYLVPSAFNAASPTYVLAVYFSKAVVGATFVSYSVLDSAGTTVASG